MSNHPNLDFERTHVWHPYASMQDPAPVYQVASADGVHLHFSDGRKVIDGMSSWWCAIHGYNVPALNQAASTQLSQMSHVMFGGLTHQPAIDLAAALLKVTPSNLEHVFFADSGSVSVEIALKMAIQYWLGQKNTQKTKFLSLEHAYHGDTFAAMSVCDPVSSMHHLFADIVPQHHFAKVDEYTIEAKLAEHHQEIAAMIIEPIVQGAGGMRFYSPELLKKIRALCSQYNVLLIADEIATGFGRTGKLFACEHADIQPDIMCIGKALTGGYMTMAAVLSDAKISAGIHKNGHVLMHGPTFMANPLACTVAKASLELLLDSPWQQRISHIENKLSTGLAPCRSLQAVADVRIMGAIGVVEMKAVVDTAKVQEMLIEQGVWLRPFGKLLYTMPPFTISDSEIEQLTTAICNTVTHINATSA